MSPIPMTRRDFAIKASAAAVGGAMKTAIAEDSRENRSNASSDFQLNYMLPSCMYGYLYLGEILPEVQKTGATAIDLWPKVHGNQREQVDDLGKEKFSQMLREAGVHLRCITQYKLGPFNLIDEMKFAQQFCCDTIVTGGKGPRELKGSELKQAVRNFIEKLRPQIAVAEETGIRIAIENHGRNLIESPDSLKWLAELSPSPHLKIAFAPYHLPQDAEALGKLVGDLGPSIAMFYAWQHGNGCQEKLPKEQELLQMPGRGPLDFSPMLASLKKMHYTGCTEIFMHPVPRGIAILESAQAVTEEINRARQYLDQKLETV